MGVFQSNVFQNAVFQGPHEPVGQQFTAEGGGRRVPSRYISREELRRLKRKFDQERRDAARLLASLSEIELAQRQLAEVEAELARLTARYFANPTKEVYNKLNDLTEQRNELALKIAELTEQETRAREAQELSERQTLKAQADAILAEIQRQQLSGRVADINLGAANSLGPQQINQAMQMARLMRIATAQQRAQQDAIRFAEQQAQQERARIAAQKAKQEDDEMNELIQLGMQWTNQS